MSFLLGFSFIFGAIIGSFLNVVTLRVPLGWSLGGRSRCVSCHHVLAPVDLVPVLSYIALRGQCRYCHVGISSRYAFVELLTGASFCLATFLYFPHQITDMFLLIFWFVVITVSIVTFIVDLEHFIILDFVTGLGSVAALLLLVLDALYNAQSVSALLIARGWGIVCGFSFFWLLWKASKGRLLGFGDVKFTIFMGIVLGFPLIIPALLFSFWLGALYAIPLLMAKRKGFKSKLPFGTFLVPAMFLAYMVGGGVIAWYGSTTGLW
ncbi:MAG: prepilin peptidase [Candidatus Doudnabacteria bacterium]|nr:prepilin peptidase [Candidatus Doudnabacteria bacterium]